MSHEGTAGSRWISTERFVLRPLIVFVTFCLVLLAMVQGGGRMVMSVVGLLEDEINLVLQTQRIQVHGVRGGWQGLNPVIRLVRAEFPAGEIDGLEVELDLLESLLHSMPVARIVAARAARIHLEETESGWQLRGMQQRPLPFDITGLLWQSDEIRGQIRVHLHALSAADSEVDLALQIFNRGALHQLELAITTPDEDDGMRLQAWQRDAQWLSADAGHALRLDGTWHLPRALTGQHHLVMRAVDAQYADADAVGGGIFGLMLERLPSANGQPLALDVGLSLERRGQQWQGLIKRLHVQTDRSGAEEISIGPIFLAGNLGGAVGPQMSFLEPRSPAPHVAFWLQQLNLSEVSRYLAANLGPQSVVGEWLSALAVTGTAHNLHGFFDAHMGFGYMATLADIAMQGYKGAPTVSNIQGQLWGHSQALAMQFRGMDAVLAFPNLYDEGWSVDRVGGVLKAWFGGGYLGLQGSHVRATLGDSEMAGGFAITRPPERSEQRLSLQMTANQLDMALAKSLVPKRLPEGVQQWVADGPQAGLLRNAQFALHGQVRMQPGELGRRIELSADVEGALIRYAQGWPMVSSLNGRVHLAGTQVRVDVESALSEQILLQDTQVVVHDNGAYATVSLGTQVEVPAALAFVRNSPLQQHLAFIKPDWSGTGQLDLRGQLRVPIVTERAPPLGVAFDFQAQQVSLTLPDYRLQIDALSGPGRFDLPHQISGQFEGRLFNQPATIGVRADADWVFFDTNGTATPDDVYHLLNSDYRLPVAGSFDFDSTLSIAMANDVSQLQVSSTLQGMAVDLPADFAKLATEQSVAEATIQFLSDYQSVSWRYRDVRGWLHYGDGIERGALGIGIEPPITSSGERAILIAGQMSQLILSDWLGDASGAGPVIPLDWTIQALQVDRFVVESVVFSDLTLTGKQRADVMSFGFAGDSLSGTVKIPASGPLEMNFDYLHLPDMAAAEGAEADGSPMDPLSVVVGRSLPAASVAVAELQLAAEPFGAWRFDIVPQEDAVDFENFNADVNGVHISQASMQWDLAANRSRFTGRIDLDDLAQTLPKWDYAASLSTELAWLTADLNWSGSPVNVSVVETSGHLDFGARNGRFIEVDNNSGGLRILGLLNFTTVAKRINFDFSDVMGEGFSFEKIKAPVDLDVGLLSFPRSMKVESSQGDFEVGGRVDLRSGVLDNEMIVTLPVSKSLPWYGVYLALANPVAGLGVLVGERVLRKPIEQFSTAKFEVTGTLEEPQVKFVSLWDKTLKEPVRPGSDALPAAPPQVPDAVENAADSDTSVGPSTGTTTLHQ